MFVPDQNVDNQLVHTKCPLILLPSNCALLQTSGTLPEKSRGKKTTERIGTDMGEKMEEKGKREKKFCCAHDLASLTLHCNANTENTPPTTGLAVNWFPG